MKLLSICALSALLSLAAAAHDLSSYPFSATLLDKGEDSYELFWRFDRDLKNITFAVRVKTTGWVGFGLSPNGEMTNSDLVLGWVDADDNKRGYLNVSLCFFFAVADYQNTAPPSSSNTHCTDPIHTSKCGFRPRLLRCAR